MSITLLTLLATLTLLCFGATAASLAHLGASVRMPALPASGQRGRMRRQALARSPLVRVVEPLLRLAGVVVGRAPLHHVRRWLSVRIDCAGHPFGLDADELLALCGASAMGLAALAHLANADAFASPLAPVWAAALGLTLPSWRLLEHIHDRQRHIVRALPEAIDLLSLCMNAGLDFQGALGLLVRAAPDRGEHLSSELRRVLEALQLGHTRQAALSALAARVPVPAVQDLVTAVVLAEHKGTPLASVLEIQATMLRLRRSVMAEERAARAATLLAFPLMLMLSSVLLLLFGPFLVGGLGF